MGGLAFRRCESCRQLAMVSDRGTVLTVGPAQRVEARDDVDRAVCICGNVVAWPKKPDTTPTVIPSGVLADAHPKYGPICEVRGHDPMNGPPAAGGSGRLVTLQNICKRCGVVYAVEAIV
jgi:hypothetical protein